MKKGFLAVICAALLLGGCSFSISLGDGAKEEPVSFSQSTESSPPAVSAGTQPETSGAPAETSETAPAASAEASAPSEAAAPSDTAGEITEDEARQIALADAGLAEEEVSRLWSEPDREDGVPVYQVEFQTENADYDYEIARADGTIVGSDYEIREEWVYAQPENAITLEDAAQLAADRTGADPADVNVWQEGDDGRMRYEGNLLYGGIWYEFEIDPETGIIFEWSAEMRG